MKGNCLCIPGISPYVAGTPSRGLTYVREQPPAEATGRADSSSAN